ncbi:MAG: hypothetical protein NT175_02230 [Bacteroidetes bacterium]|nr:hypothetical protein [Bacteroidota bacterium]
MPKEYMNYLGLALTISVIFQMFAQGLTYSYDDLFFFRKRRGLLLRSLVAVDVVVPLCAFLLIYFLHPPKHVAAGLAILVSCPAAPLHLQRIQQAGGKREYLVSLHLILAILSLITIPITLGLMSLALDFKPAYSIMLITKMVMLLVVVPVSLGIFIRSKVPLLAAHIQKTIRVIGFTVLLLGIFFLVIYTFELMLKKLLDMDFLSYLVIILMICMALTIGYFMAPKEPEERMTLALESAARHPGFALLIASTSFTFDKAEAILIPYLFVFIIISGLYIQWEKQRLKKSASMLLKK